MIELPLLGGVVAFGNAAELDLRLLPGKLGRPDAVKTDRVAPRAALRAILDQVAALARGEDPQTEAGQVVIPDKVVLVPDLGGIHNALAELGHRPSFTTLCHASAEAPRKQMGANSR